MDRFRYQPRLQSVDTVEVPSFRLALGLFVSNIAKQDKHQARK